MPDADPFAPASSRSDEPRFDLIAELGRGGMATVYLARRRGSEKLIVLKHLRADLAESGDFLAMFLEEARLAGKLTHPNIVETFEVGRDRNIYYIAMEYLDGLSLQAILAKVGWKGTFSFALHVRVLIDVLRALEHASTQRDDNGIPLAIVHRDVSPPNVIVTFDGQAKLVDFGIAKAASTHLETRTGLIKGKLTYMAPEQAASGDVDSRTDIYSVGVMLWQAAAGTRRWKGLQNTEVLRRVLDGDVVASPHAERNGLPTIVNEICMRAIAANADDRYATPSEMRRALEQLLDDELSTAATHANIAAFMEAEFGTAHRRAKKVIVNRLRELAEAMPAIEKAPETLESETAIRVAPKAARESKRKVKAEVNAAAKPQADHATATNATSPSRTLVSPAIEQVRSRKGRSTTLWLGVLASVAFAIALLALETVKRSPRAAPPVSASAGPLEPEAPAPPSGMEGRAVTAPDPNEAIAPRASGPGPWPSSHANLARESSSTKPVRESSVPRPIASPSSSSASSPSSQTSATPRLDASDPWSGGRMDPSDPWANDGSTTPGTRPTPQ